MKLTLLSVLSTTLFALSSLCQTPPDFSLITTDKPLAIAYGNTTITPGTALVINQTLISPQITFPSSSTNVTHLLLLIDLDAPYGWNSTNTTFSPILHWLQPNIPANLPIVPSNYSPITTSPSTNTTLPTLSNIAPYIHPNPPAGSVLHRYVALAYDQPTTPFALTPAFQYLGPDVEKRLVFDLVGFVKHEGLDGRLVGATWFTVAPYSEDEMRGDGGAGAVFEGGAEGLGGVRVWAAGWVVGVAVGVWAVVV